MEGVWGGGGAGGVEGEGDKKGEGDERGEGDKEGYGESDGEGEGDFRNKTDEIAAKDQTRTITSIQRSFPQNWDKTKISKVSVYQKSYTRHKIVLFVRSCVCISIRLVLSPLNSELVWDGHFWTLQ